MRRRLYIVTQRYPDHLGRKPLSFAVYYGKEFLCYSFTLSGAYIALQYIKHNLFATVGGE